MTSGSQADIAGQIAAALALSEPDLDTTTGTVVAKIIDAVAGSISSVYLDQQLLTYTYDIDSKTGADLDAFVQLFGIARLPAMRATGTATFSRSGSDIATTAFIAIGTQISDGNSPPNIFQTVTGSFMAGGVTSVVVPIQAVTAGSQANVTASSINTIVTPITGVSSVINLSGTSGGEAQETDTALRARWKATVFRNLAGTEQMYLGVALADPDCFAANVVSATKINTEQVQFNTGTITSTVSDAQYIFSTPVTLGTDIDNGDVFSQGSDYTFNSSVNPPTVTAVNSTNIPTGTVCELQYQYTPVASRNTPSSGIINRVDVYCGGDRDIAATQTVIFNTGLTFTSSGTYPAAHFQRTSGATPTVNNVFVPLAFGPVVTMSPQITIGSTVYGLITPTTPAGVSDGVTYAYHIIHDVTNLGMTPASLFGLEWEAAYLPTNLSTMNIGGDGAYTFNQIPTSVQQSLDQWRLLGIDARAHQALYRPLKFSLAVVYDVGQTPSVINSAMDAALGAWISSLGMNAGIQVSDAIQMLHNVAGVDNIRFLNSSDDSPTNGIAIQQFSLDGTLLDTYVDGNGRATDVYFTDAELPTFFESRYVLKARNSFGNL